MDTAPVPSEGSGLNVLSPLWKYFPRVTGRLLQILSALGVGLYIHSPYDKE